MTYPEKLHKLPAQAQKNYHANRTLLRMDIILAFALIGFSASAFHSAMLVILPFWGALADYVGTLLRIYLTPKSPFTPLPSDIRARVASVVELPPRTYFWRGTGNDCRSISFYFLHIIFLPEGFEDKLDEPNTQAILHHEFSHDRFFDYLCLFWVLFALFTGVGVLFLQANDILKFGTPIGFEKGSANNFYAWFMPFVLMVIICLINIKSIFYRKELNADFEASLRNPEIYEAYLQGRINKQKYFKTRIWNPLTWIINKFTHPSFSYRLDFISGKTKASGASYIVPSIIMGFCPAFIMFSMAVGIGKFTLRSDFSASAITSTVFGIIGTFQCAYFFQEAFGRNNSTSFSEKKIIWFYMLLGSLLFAIVMVLGSHLDFEKVGMPLKSHPSLFLWDLIIAVFTVIFGYIQLALYFWLCARFVGSMYLSILAVLIFGFTSYIHAGTHLNLGFGNPPLALLVSLFMIIVPAIIATVIEYIALKIAKAFSSSSANTSS
ncbi:MAG: hypothetical protein ACRBBN_12680 [Methyloligellaceae bacterium]